MDQTTGLLWVEATPVDRAWQQELGLAFCLSSSQLTKVDVSVSRIIVKGFCETVERRRPCLSDRHRPGARRTEPQHFGVVAVWALSSYQTAPRDGQLAFVLPCRRERLAGRDAILDPRGMDLSIQQLTHALEPNVWWYGAVPVASALRHDTRHRTNWAIRSGSSSANVGSSLVPAAQLTEIA